MAMLPARSADYALIQLDGKYLKWGAPQFGAPGLATYGFVTRPTRFPATRNCSSMTRIEPEALGPGITETRWSETVRSAFAAWSAIAGIQFRPARANERANILIGIQAEPQGWAFTDVSPSRVPGATGSIATRGLNPQVPPFPPSGTASSVATLRQALICLNPRRSWKIGLDGNVRVYDLGFTLMHEIGHAIGLDHPSNGDALMHFRYRDMPASLHQGDILGARFLYGPPG
ncbi:MAG: matrixin family metalloprotease [Hyphomicrobiaceae bacterium]